MTNSVLGEPGPIKDGTVADVLGVDGCCLIMIDTEGRVFQFGGKWILSEGTINQVSNPRTSILEIMERLNVVDDD